MYSCSALGVIVSNVRADWFNKLLRGEVVFPIFSLPGLLLSHV